MTQTQDIQTAASTVDRYFRIAIAILTVALVLAMYPYTNDPTGDIKSLILGWGATILGAWWLFSAWWMKRTFRRPRLFFELLLCLMVLYLIATLRSSFWGASFGELGRFVFLFILYLVASQVFHTPEQVQRWMLVVCCAVLASSFYGFLQSAGVDPFPWADRQSDTYKQLPATFGNPNYAGHTLILTLVMTPLLFCSASKKRWALLFAVAFAIHLNATGHRAGILALGAALLLFLIARGVRCVIASPVKTTLITLILTLVCLAMGAVGAMTVCKLKTGSPFPLDSSILLRYHSYTSASRMALDHPLLGHGPGVYAMAYPNYWTHYEQEFFAREVRMNAHVHNDLLEIAVDAGIPAAGLYLTLLLVAIGYGLLWAQSGASVLQRRLGYTFAALFCVFLIDGLFGFNLRVPVSATLLFLVLGAMEGVVGAAHAPVQMRKKTPVWMKLVCVGACILLLQSLFLTTRSFSSEMELQKGMIAQHQAQKALQHKKAGLASEKLHSAAQHYFNGEALAPWNGYFARRCGQVAQRQRKLDEAIQAYERALSKNPYYVLNHLDLADLKMLQAQKQIQESPEKVQESLRLLDDAAQHVAKLLLICPMYPGAHERIGRIAAVSALFLAGVDAPNSQERLEQYWKTAEQHLLMALQYDTPNQSELFRLLAKIRVAREDITGAEDALVRAVAADPTDQQTWPFFLSFANQHKRYHQARQVLLEQEKQLKGREVKDEAALAMMELLLANVLETGFNDIQGAERAYQEAVKYGPKRPEVWANFARYAHQHNRRDLLLTAVAQSCAHVEVAGEKPLGYLAAANAVLQKGAPVLQSASEVLVSHVRAHRPGDGITPGQAYGWVAQLMLETLLRTPLEVPGACETYLNLGIAFAGMDQLTTAERLFAKADSCLQGNLRAPLAIYWADVLMRQSQGEEALRRLREACEAFPDHLDARWAFARTLAKLELYDEAIVEYDKLLALDNLEPKGRVMLEKERSTIVERNAKTARLPIHPGTSSLVGLPG